MISPSPVSFRVTLQVAASKRYTTRSAPAAASTLPSGENATRVRCFDTGPEIAPPKFAELHEMME
jgi:hypothetical protein